MLHILLMLLKIILWILLGILGLVLLLVLLVLFAPISYGVRARYKDKAYVKAKVHFLFVSLMIEFDQEKKSLDKAIKIFGIRLVSKRKKKAEKIKKKKDKEADVRSNKLTEHKTEEKNEISGIDEMPAIKDISADDEMQAELIDGVSDEKMDDVISDEKMDYGISDEKMNDDLVNKKMDENESSWDNDSVVNNNLQKKASLGQKIKKISYKFKEIWINLSPEYVMDRIDEKGEFIRDKKAKYEKKLKKIKKFWNMQCTVKTRNYIGKYILSVLKHIGPRKIKGYVHYGLKEPCKTGQLTGYLSMLPFVYQKGFSIQPDFYEQIFEIDVDMKGHFNIGYILRIAVKPYIWKTIKMAKRLDLNK